MKSETTPAIAKLLRAADDLLAVAKDLQAEGRHAQALQGAMLANEYVRAARAMQDMEDAFRG